MNQFSHLQDGDEVEGRKVVRKSALYKPRRFQRLVHLELKRFNVLVCHRRFGKTVLCVNELIDRSTTNPLYNPRYVYVAPTFRQAEEIAWQYFLDYTQHLPHVKVNKTKLKIMVERPWRKHPVTGESEPDVVTIALIGGQNYDGIRGWYLDGGVLDEFAQCDPQIYSKVIRPAMADRRTEAKELGITVDLRGRPFEPWIIFLGTPNGQNHFYHRFRSAQIHEAFAGSYRAKYDTEFQKKRWLKFESDNGIHENLPTVERDKIMGELNPKVVRQYLRYRKFAVADSWYTGIYKASETGVLDQIEIDEMTQDLAPEEVEQELECSFTAAVRGSYYGKVLTDIDKQGHIGDFPWDPSSPVSTFWDLGISDKCTVWFRQRIGNWWIYIDYIEFEGKGIPEIAKELNKLPYNVSRHVWPHDGAAREFGTGVTRQETARRNGMHNVYIQPKQAVADRIDASRLRLRISKFDAKKCARGLECLYNYQKEYDDKNMVFRDTPKHDWSSHGSDSFGYSSLDSLNDSDFQNFDPSSTMSAVTDYNELGAR